MAYYRKRKRYLRPNRGYKRRYSRRKLTTGQAARIALRGVNRIKKSVELKKFDFFKGASNITSGGFVDQICDIARESTSTTRIGDVVYAKGLTLKGSLQQDFGASYPVQRVRCVIFRGRQENEQTVNVATIFAVSGINQSKTFDKRFKTKVLYDKIHTMTDGTSTGRQINVHVPINMPIRYDSSDASGATIEDGGIYVLWIAEDGLSDPPQVNYFTRLTYTDS